MDHTEGRALLPLDDPEDGSVLIDPDLLPILERVRWGRKRKANGDLIGMGNVYSLDWSANYILPRERYGEHVHLGRWIAKAPKGWFVEYLNGNGLDCRRVNLRPVKNSGQATWRWRDKLREQHLANLGENVPAWKITPSGFWVGANGKWER